MSLDELKKKAVAADLCYDSSFETSFDPIGPPRPTVTVTTHGTADDQDNLLRYFAAASPDVVLALLERLADAEKLLKKNEDLLMAVIRNVDDRGMQRALMYDVEIIMRYFKKWNPTSGASSEGGET